MALDSRDRLLAGRYRRLRHLGTGGMARVYLAEDELLARQVAVKVLHADSPDDAALRFEREAKVGASLNHPNLVSIFDIATDEETVLIVMEYVDGETLADAIRRGPMAPAWALAVVRDVAAGLDHAHAHRVVHRDVKPANILLRNDGIAKLADLGIATAAERTSVTQSDVVLGTASYMAPEQLAGGEAGPRSDVYALAAVAFEALSGRKARSGRTPVEVAHEVVNGPPPDLRGAWPDAPEPAVGALARGMARDPRDRPASAGALALELERGLRPRPGPRAATARRSTPTGSTVPLPPPSRGRHRWMPAATVATLALVASAVTLALLDRGDGDGRDPDRAAVTREQEPPAERRARRRAESDGSRGEQASSDPAPAEPESPAPTDPEPAAGVGDPAALNEEGYRLMQAGRYEQAIPLLEQAVNSYPEGSQELTYAYALYNLGRSLRLAGRADEAVPILERRLRIPNQTKTVERELEAARRAVG